MVAVTDRVARAMELFGVPLIGKGFVLLKLTTAAPTPKLPLRLMPSCLMTVRFTSATVTLSITWS
jgi:hypothetical protein